MGTRSGLDADGLTYVESADEVTSGLALLSAQQTEARHAAPCRALLLAGGQDTQEMTTAAIRTTAAILSGQNAG